MTHSEVPIHYRITPARPEAHLYNIRCIIAAPDANGQRIWLPAWIPGSYMIRDFSRHLITLTASCNGQSISCHKIDKQTWQCVPCVGPLQLDYEVYAWDLSVRAAHLDTTHAYYNGTSVFLAVSGQEHLPVDVEICRPAGERYQQWRVATTLSRKSAQPYAFGLYTAANYDELIDHPVEIGDFASSEFAVNGIPHAIVITGRQHADLTRLTQDVKTICDCHVQLFGELPAMQQYLFMLMVTDSGYGGLEHRCSTSLLCSRKSLPLANMTSPTDDYTTLLGLFSHEYFHTWNVKQIKPIEFIPYDLTREVPTPQLWAFEGITSYYDDLALVRSGIISPDKYLELLAKSITRVIREPGRFKQTLPESSFDAWTKYYKQDENSPNAIVSYYVKGALFALSLDLLIRKESQHQHSLDTVLQQLWRDHGKSGHGVTADTIQIIIANLIGNVATDFFTTYLYGTTDLPLWSLLAEVGVDFILRPACSDDDMGGKEGDKKDYLPFTLAGRFAADTAGARIITTYDNGALQRAGLAAGDVLIAINGLKVNKDNIKTLLAPYRVNDTLLLHAFRRDELMEFNLTLEPSINDTCFLKWQDAAAEKRRLWLHH